jgi:hypothetical protein
MDRNPVVVELLQEDHQHPPGGQVNQPVRADMNLDADPNHAVIHALRRSG